MIEPMSLFFFYTPWEHQKIIVFWCSQGVVKETSGMKWVHIFYNGKIVEILVALLCLSNEVPPQVHLRDSSSAQIPCSYSGVPPKNSRYITVMTGNILWANLLKNLLKLKNSSKKMVLLKVIIILNIFKNKHMTLIAIVSLIGRSPC